MYDDTDFSQDLMNNPAFKQEPPVGIHTFNVKGLDTFVSKNGEKFYSFVFENEKYETSIIMKDSRDDNMFKFLNVYKEAFLKFVDDSLKEVIEKNWNSWANIKIACDAMNEDLTLVTLEISDQADSKYTKKTFIFPEDNDEVKDEPFQSNLDEEKKDENLF